MNICFECLHKQKPWISKDSVILYSQPSECSECGENKQLVFNFTDDQRDKLFNTLTSDIKVSNYPWNDVCEKLDFSLQTLVSDLGWDKVRNRYMYIKGQEEGKPLAFRTSEEYEPYLNYRVVNLKDSIIIKKKTIIEKEIGV